MIGSVVGPAGIEGDQAIPIGLIADRIPHLLAGTAISPAVHQIVAAVRCHRGRELWLARLQLPAAAAGVGEVDGLAGTGGAAGVEHATRAAPSTGGPKVPRIWGPASTASVGERSSIVAVISNFARYWVLTRFG